MAALGLLLIASGRGLAADVDVEGIYTTNGSTVVAEIFANISETTPILSYGVKLNYDAAQMTVVSAEKNEAVWFFGDGTPAGNKPYMNPDTSTAGQVIIIGGTLNTADPTGGVSGRRLLLGRVTFNRASTSYKPVLTIANAKAAPYSNFVRTNGTVLDGTAGMALTTNVYELGDANASGAITPPDINAVKALIGSTTYHVYADCNCDGKITPPDINCVKGKIK